MYIKQLTIQGFRSYRDQTIVEPFSPQHNCIVGRNGSGKSNFFAAIRFVLGDAFTSLRAEERQELLHVRVFEAGLLGLQTENRGKRMNAESSNLNLNVEGTGLAVMSAYVEIVFDNTDQRLPIEKDEVVLRRTIGLKKDEYFLDRKHVNKSDVANLLESAGFSRSNPYYIVQQGKVNHLVSMKDSDRLQLLMEVAGTRVYDDKREQSLKLMMETDKRRENINEMLGYIDERLKELEGEKEELREYQTLDRERRALEFTVYDRELNDTRAKLERLENSRQEESEVVSQLHVEAARVHDAVRAAERELKLLETAVDALAKEKALLEEERQESLRTRAKLELDIKDAEDFGERGAETSVKLKADLAALEAEINATEKTLVQVGPRHADLQRKEKEITEHLAITKQRITELYAREKRGQRFSSKAERDAWLREEVKKVDASRHSGEKQLASSRSQIARLQESLEKKKAERVERAAALEDRRTKLEELIREYESQKVVRDENMNQRKEMWRRDADLDTAVQTYRTETQRAERSFQSTIPKILALGMRSVKRLTQEHHVGGVYGPLIELFDCEPKYATAVEVSAGNGLFHIVVDTEDTASTLLRLMNHTKAPGRVTFMPLNRLTPKTADAPMSEDAFMMIDKLVFDPIFRPAFQQIFGKTLVCRNLEVATQFARDGVFDSITLDGDQVNRKGALTGGFYDSRRLRLDIMRRLKELGAQKAEAEAESAQLKGEIAEKDQLVTRLLGDMEKLEARRSQLSSSFEQLNIDIRSLDKEIAAVTIALKKKEERLDSLESQQRQLDAQKTSYDQEIGTNLVKKLGDADQATLRGLIQEADDAQLQLTKIQSETAEAGSEHASHEQNLNSNLLRQRAALQQRLQDLGVSAATISLDSRRKELELVSTSLETSAARIAEIDTELEKAGKRVQELKKDVDELKASEETQFRELNDGSKSMELLLNKRSLHMQKRDDCMRRIRDLGSLPAGTFEQYQDVDMRELMRRLHAVNEKLQRYSHVNKKALDQFVSFTEQRENLTKRKQELDQSDKSIHELIAHLDTQKDEAIERTFKGVAKNFREVFEELVAGGRAGLVMLRPSDDDNEEAGAGAGAGAEQAERAKKKPRIAQYTGIAIRVAFKRDGEVKNMQQLSGGQKALVALALIFAVQRLDAAPFYLFDETDAPLDTSARVAVAALIQKQSQSAQFITTSFRPELVTASDRCYMILFQNKVSTVRLVDQQEAMAMITEEEQEAAAAGAAAAAAAGAGVGEE